MNALRRKIISSTIILICFVLLFWGMYPAKLNMMMGTFLFCLLVIAQGFFRKNAICKGLAKDPIYSNKLSIVLRILYVLSAVGYMFYRNPIIVTVGIICLIIELKRKKVVAQSFEEPFLYYIAFWGVISVLVYEWVTWV